MRSAEVTRKTRETEIRVSVCLDQAAEPRIATGHGFFDHMLASFAKHSRFAVEVKAKGDDTGPHHLVEDTGIVLGECLQKAAGERLGIERYGEASLPMDEALVSAAVDFGGRGFLVFSAPEFSDLESGLGVPLLHDFFHALATNGRFNLHLAVAHGRNPHHVAEAMFKATAVALRRALATTGGSENPSLKSTPKYS